MTLVAVEVERNTKTAVGNRPEENPYILHSFFLGCLISKVFSLSLLSLTHNNYSIRITMAVIFMVSVNLKLSSYGGTTGV